MMWGNETVKDTTEFRDPEERSPLYEPCHVLYTNRDILPNTELDCIEKPSNST